MGLFGVEWPGILGYLAFPAVAKSGLVHHGWEVGYRSPTSSIHLIIYSVEYVVNMIYCIWYMIHCILYIIYLIQCVILDFVQAGSSTLHP